MIEKILFKEFKSFENSEIELKHITVLIGSNGSGKSNAIDGLRILSGSTTGTDLAVVLDGARGSSTSGFVGVPSVRCGFVYCRSVCWPH